VAVTIATSPGSVSAWQVRGATRRHTSTAPVAPRTTTVRLGCTITSNSVPLTPIVAWGVRTW